MPHHKSAKKRVRQTEKRTLANKAQKSQTRSSIKKVRGAIEAGDKQKAAELLTSSQSLLARLAKKGVIKSGLASRVTSRLAGQINKLS